MKAKRKPQAKAAMLAVPERVRARRLAYAITEAMEQLAQLARAELSTGKPYAAAWLGALPALATRKVVETLADAPDAPCKLSQVFTIAVTDAVREFGDAVDKRPAQFQQWARRQLVWPVLRAVLPGWQGKERRGKRDTFPDLAEKLCLGADANIKRDGVVDWGSLANRETARRLLAIPRWQEWAADADSKTVAPWVLKLAATQFPPLTREPEVLRFYYQHGLKPLLDADKPKLLPGLVLAKRKTGERPDYAVWNDFLKACRDALEALAPRPTPRATCRQ